jgi:hypothetical protein
MTSPSDFCPEDEAVCSFIPSQDQVAICHLQNDITLNITIVDFVLKILFHWPLISQRTATPRYIFTKNQMFRFSYSLCSLSCERSIASSIETAIECFHFQVPVSSPVPKVIQWLLTSSFSYPLLRYFTSIFTCITCFRTQLLHKM